jgi:hypothetical protein
MNYAAHTIKVEVDFHTGEYGPYGGALSLSEIWNSGVSDCPLIPDNNRPFLPSNSTRKVQ